MTFAAFVALAVPALMGVSNAIGAALVQASAWLAKATFYDWRWLFLVIGFALGVVDDRVYTAVHAFLVAWHVVK